MATKLRKLRITHVAAVDRGANQHAHVLLWKRAEPLTKDEAGRPRTVSQILSENEARQQWWELQRALEGSVQEIMEHATPEEQNALLTQTLGEFSAQALKLIPQMSASVAKRLPPVVEDLVKAGRVIASERLGRLKAAMTALAQIIREAEPEEKDDDMADSDIEKRAQAAEAEAAALKKQLEEATARLAKGDPETLSKQLADTKKLADEAIALAKREQEWREERDYIEKAQGYTTLPVSPKEDWKVFKEIDAMSASTRDRLLELLHAADGQLAIAGALGAVGKGGERRGGSSAWDEASGLASGIISKSAGMSFDTAIQQVWRERPDLYKRHRRESSSRS